MDNIRLFAPETQDSLTYTGNAIILNHKKRDTLIQISQIVSFEVLASSNGKKPGKVTIKTAGSNSAFIGLTSSVAIGAGNEIIFLFDPACTDRAMKIRDLIASGGSNNTTGETVSAADEIRKFKSLLDDGIITQEEFDTKKKQLLGL